jgi:hypothetical protein
MRLAYPALIIAAGAVLAACSSGSSKSSVALGDGDGVRTLIR